MFAWILADCLEVPDAGKFGVGFASQMACNTAVLPRSYWMRVQRDVNSVHGFPVLFL